MKELMERASTDGKAAQLPNAFLWGAATAAYQVEGAATADGRGLSHWDEFCKLPGKTAAGDTGDIACDHYHRYANDIALMGDIGLNAYRFSVSWPRVIPNGIGAINPRGLDFYDRLVDSLCAADITPMTTLYHWDLPLHLQNTFGGWEHADAPRWFADYADVVFARLGDRVRLWLTLNEPWVVVDAGYFHGVHPPGVRDRRLGFRVGHHLLLAHALATQRFRAANYSGAISFALNTTFAFPESDTPADHAAAERSMLNFAGWFTDPLVFGDYPTVMRERWGDLLPQFTDEQTRLLRNSVDFIALNYYFSDVVRHAPDANTMEIELMPQPGAPKTEMGWTINPDGLERLLIWLHERYRLPIYITENGAAMPDKPDASGFVDDQDRIAYLRTHLTAADRAMKAGVDLRGYFTWSLMDNLEWTLGFSKRFGLIRCDFETLKRTPKASARWYSEFIRSRQTTPAVRPLTGAIA